MRFEGILRVEFFGKGPAQAGLLAPIKKNLSSQKECLGEDGNQA
jgi:hypothetical protein